MIDVYISAFFGTVAIICMLILIVCEIIGKDWPPAVVFFGLVSLIICCVASLFVVYPILVNSIF